MNISEFKDDFTVSGPFQAFCQPGYVPDVARKVTKLVDCEFCHSHYNPNNLTRKRRHESKECVEK